MRDELKEGLEESRYQLVSESESSREVFREAGEGACDVQR
jgi:hypothetical protein